MIHLNLDTEQAMMVVIAMEASNAMLKARLHRVDPDKILSNSSILQEHKIEQIKAQMDSGQIATWADLPVKAKADFIALCLAAIDEDQDARVGAIYDRMLSQMLGARAGQLFIGDRPAVQT